MPARCLCRRPVFSGSFHIITELSGQGKPGKCEWQKSARQNINKERLHG
jgi:hypothetical protein